MLVFPEYQYIQLFQVQAVLLKAYPFLDSTDSLVSVQEMYLAGDCFHVCIVSGFVFDFVLAENCHRH